MFVFSGHEAYVEDRIKSQGEHKLFLVPGTPDGLDRGQDPLACRVKRGDKRRSVAACAHAFERTDHEQGRVLELLLG